MSIRVPNNPKKEVNDIRYATAEGMRQVMRVMYVTTAKTAHLVWEMIVGFIFTKDAYSLKTKDGFIIKCKDQ